MSANVIAELVGPDGRTVHVRHAAPDDAAAILVYLRQVGGESPYLSFGDEGLPASEEDERAFLAKTGELDNAICLVAERDGEIVASLTFVGGDRPRLRHIGQFGISVARACQGVGLGRRLIQLLIDWAEQGGVVRKIGLIVRADNARAVALYESLGFKTEGRITREIIVDGVFHESLMMGRAVDPRS